MLFLFEHLPPSHFRFSEFLSKMTCKDFSFFRIVNQYFHCCIFINQNNHDIDIMYIYYNIYILYISSLIYVFMYCIHHFCSPRCFSRKHDTKRLGICSVALWQIDSFCLRLHAWHRVEHLGSQRQPKNGLVSYVPGSKLPLFPYNRGWSSTQ